MPEALSTFNFFRSGMDTLLFLVKVAFSPVYPLSTAISLLMAQKASKIIAFFLSQKVNHLIYALVRNPEVLILGAQYFDTSLQFVQENIFCECKKERSALRADHSVWLFASSRFFCEHLLFFEPFWHNMFLGSIYGVLLKLCF